MNNALSNGMVRKEFVNELSEGAPEEPGVAVQHLYATLWEIGGGYIRLAIVSAAMCSVAILYTILRKNGVTPSREAIGGLQGATEEEKKLITAMRLTSSLGERTVLQEKEIAESVCVETLTERFFPFADRWLKNSCSLSLANLFGPDIGNALAAAERTSQEMRASGLAPTIAVLEPVRRAVLTASSE